MCSCSTAEQDDMSRRSRRGRLMDGTSTSSLHPDRSSCCKLVSCSSHAGSALIPVLAKLRLLARAQVQGLQLVKHAKVGAQLGELPALNGIEGLQVLQLAERGRELRDPTPADGDVPQVGKGSNGFREF